MDDIAHPLEADRAVVDEAPNEDARLAPGAILTDRLAIVAAPQSPAAESIRALRANLLAKHVQEGRRGLAICATSAGAGCSFVAANLAMAMAEGGVNTLLVDANLRDPGLDSYMAPTEPGPGLAECLADATLPLTLATRSVHPKLAVLLAGADAREASDLIGTNVFRSLMGACMRDYDLTIVDTPPAHAFADARRIAAVMRHAMIVTCRDRTFVKDVRTLVDELESDKANVVGTYLNDY